MMFENSGDTTERLARLHANVSCKSDGNDGEANLELRGSISPF